MAVSKVEGKKLIVGVDPSGNLVPVAVDAFGNVLVVGGGVTSASDVRLKDAAAGRFASVDTQGRVATTASVTPADNVHTTGTITAVNDVVTAATTKSGSTFAVQLNVPSSFVGTLVVEGSVNGTDWYRKSFRASGGGGTIYTSIVNPIDGQVFFGQCAADDQIRVKCTVRTSGTVMVEIIEATGAVAIYLLGELPAGTQHLGEVSVSNFPASVEISNDVGNAIPVSGPLTDTQLRATPVPVTVTDTRGLVERMFVKAPQTGYNLWFDTADATYIYIAEAPIAANPATDTTYQGIRVTKDASGNPFGEVQQATGFAWNNRAAAGWA